MSKAFKEFWDKKNFVGDKISKSDKQRIDREIFKNAMEKKESNPWAICTAQVGRESSKYEDCVMDVKSKLGLHKDMTEEQYNKSNDDDIRIEKIPYNRHIIYKISLGKDSVTYRVDEEMSGNEFDTLQESKNFIDTLKKSASRTQKSVNISELKHKIAQHEESRPEFRGLSGISAKVTYFDINGGYVDATIAIYDNGDFSDDYDVRYPLSKFGFSKDIGVDYAGPDPKSGLAEQDLEVDTHSTTKPEEDISNDSREKEDVSGPLPNRFEFSRKSQVQKFDSLYKDLKEEDYYDWQSKVVEELRESLDMTTGDAQDMVEVQSSYMEQLWSKKTAPKQAAKLIEQKAFHKSDSDDLEEQYSQIIVGHNGKEGKDRALEFRYKDKVFDTRREAERYIESKINSSHKSQVQNYSKTKKSVDRSGNKIRPGDKVECEGKIWTYQEDDEGELILNRNNMQESIYAKPYEVELVKSQVQKVSDAEMESFIIKIIEEDLMSKTEAIQAIMKKFGMDKEMATDALEWGLMNKSQVQKDKKIDIVVEPNGGASVNCHLCNKHYHFPTEQMARQFAEEHMKLNHPLNKSQVQKKSRDYDKAKEEALRLAKRDVDGFKLVMALFNNFNIDNQEAEEIADWAESKVDKIKSQSNKDIEKKILDNEKQIADQLQQFIGNKGRAWFDDGSAGVNLNSDLSNEEKSKLKELIRNKFYGRRVGDGYQEGEIWVDGDEI